MAIAKIIMARVTRYQDNGQTIAYVGWRDLRGKEGTTLGDPNNQHMRALLARARNEGIRVKRERQG